MSAYKITKMLYETVILEFWEEFDTNDQEKWNVLRSYAEDAMFEDEFKKIPEEAPEDPSLWFQLYKYYEEHEYLNAEPEDWVSSRKGSTDYTYILEDSQGEVIQSE